MSKPTPEQVEAVGLNLRRISHGLKRHMAILLSAEGLTFPQMTLLRVICHKQNPTLADVTGELHLAPSTVSGIVKRLERDGLVERLPDPDDLRVYRLRITAKADKMLRETFVTYNQHLARILSHFSERELAALDDALRKLSIWVEQEVPTRPERKDTYHG